MFVCIDEMVIVVDVYEVCDGWWCVGYECVV